jgi:hypothetical protein
VARNARNIVNSKFPPSIALPVSGYWRPCKRSITAFFMWGVNFPKKVIVVNFDPEKIKLSEVATLLKSLGYTPEVAIDEKNKKAVRRSALV